MAAAASCRCSRVVYVGNIAFHASEKELRDACELIGPVLSLRAATDPATGKRRGYAFVEYADDETARSACRNLDGHFLRGRNLRVGLAGRQQGRRRRDDDDPVGMEDAVHAACLVSGKPLEPVTRYLAAQSTREVRQMVATLEGIDSDTTGLLKEHLPGLATLMEQAKHLLDMAAADAAAKETRDKKRTASACAPTAEASKSNDDDHGSKIRKMQHGGNFKSAVSAAGVACF